MKKFFFFLSLTILFATITSCSWVKPEFEGVLMTNCGKNGIEDFKIVTGKVNTMGLCTELIRIPMFEQTGDAPELEVMTADGGTFQIDPAYTYNAIRGKGPNIAFMYKQFASDGDDFLEDVEDNILDRRVVNLYREKARTFTTDSLMRNLNLFENSVEQELRLQFQEAFFELKELTSGLVPPESMRRAIEDRNAMRLQGEKVEQQMSKEKAQLQIELEKARTKVEIARLEAEANRERAKGLTPEVLRDKAIEGWIKNGCPMPRSLGSSSFYNLIDEQK
jgi:hypothetical protein